MSQEQGVLLYDGRRTGMSQLKQRGNPPLLQLFVLFRPPADWMIPTSIDEINLLSLMILMLTDTFIDNN